MSKTLYHISDLGVGVCRAEIKCPFGGKSGFEDHSTNVFEVARRYEDRMKEKEIQTHSKKSPDSRSKVSGRANAANTIRNASEGQNRTNKGNEPASQNQFDFIKTLRMEREVPEEFYQMMKDSWKRGTFTHAAAFEFTRTMRTFPEKKDIVEHHKSLVGYHKLEDGRLIKVNRSKTGYMYATEYQFSKDGSQVRSRQVKIETLNELTPNTPLSQNDAISLDRALVRIGKVK